MNKTTKKIFRLIIFIVFILFIISVSILLLLIKKKEKNVNNDDYVPVVVAEEKDLKNVENEAIIDKLSNMTERDRIEYYFSRFISAVEEEKYENAYGMLYDDFKENFFPDLESFEEYAKKTFSKFSDIKHTNFERNGDIYIMFITITDSLASKSEAKEMKFVVKENNFNDFVLSFSVI